MIGKVFWVGSLGSIGHMSKEAVLEGMHELSRTEFVRRSHRCSTRGCGSDWEPHGFVREADDVATRALRVFEACGDEQGQATAWALLVMRLKMLGHADGVEEAW